MIFRLAHRLAHVFSGWQPNFLAGSPIFWLAAEKIVSQPVSQPELTHSTQ
jgi:hypothetical protein